MGFSIRAPSYTRKYPITPMEYSIGDSGEYITNLLGSLPSGEGFGLHKMIKLYWIFQVEHKATIETLASNHRPA